MVRTETEIRGLALQYKKALEPAIHVERIVLYGSYATGNPHTWSDIDFAVISRDFANKSRWERQGILGRAKLGDPDLQDAMISPLGYSVGEYTRAHRQSFLGEIKRTGKTLYKRRARHTTKRKRRQSRA
jgi:predicted nucleotidyltransferase